MHENVERLTELNIPTSIVAGWDHLRRYWREPVILAIVLYLFLYSINLLSHAFKLFGKEFAETMLATTSNPFLGLFLGIVSTSVIQSSSTTTAIIVGLVAAGNLSIGNAIPLIMGSNIGTTVTTILVSFGHARHRLEFSRAFTASIVHDIFNLCSVLILFPLELKFHLIEIVARKLGMGFVGIGGLKLFNPLKVMINPIITITDKVLSIFPYTATIMAVLSLILLFFIT